MLILPSQSFPSWHMVLWTLYRTAWPVNTTCLHRVSWRNCRMAGIPVSIPVEPSLMSERLLHTPTIKDNHAILDPTSTSCGVTRPDNSFLLYGFGKWVPGAAEVPRLSRRIESVHSGLTRREQLKCTEYSIRYHRARQRYFWRTGGLEQGRSWTPPS